MISLPMSIPVFGASTGCALTDVCSEQTSVIEQPMLAPNTGIDIGKLLMRTSCMVPPAQSGRVCSRPLARKHWLHP